MLDDLIDRMKNFEYKDLVQASGIHYNQLWRLRTGKDTNPTTRTVVRIHEALVELEKDADTESE